jgi:hypothetical protein
MGDYQELTLPPACLFQSLERGGLLPYCWSIVSSYVLYTQGAFFANIIQSDSKLLSEFPWPVNVNPDNNLESSYICMFSGGPRRTELGLTEYTEI